ncbi:uncharacterized protein LOC130956895 [Arachis stenosperma]|uniref:uncharacterized protein LOC130956895 n=1 Tax=Arachis stenosperma TaxID=217475 RepID=UPI0025AD76C0|nr:uncharacterized protein LOC130956895 [Arachis stenosperma]
MDDIDQSEIYDPSVNSLSQVASLVDHPLFSQSEIQGCLDVGDPNYECSFCGACFWLSERVERDSTINRPVFTVCCSKGKIQLPYLQKTPDLLYNLINGNDRKSLYFQKNIRSYNSMFAFTSLGGKVLDSVNDGSGPPQFIITGQNYHRIGSLLLDPGQKPKFAQLYIYDTQHEIMHRREIFRQTSEMDEELIIELLQMIDTHNVIAQSFRRAREFYQCHPSEIFSLKLYSHRKVDRRNYNPPSCDEVAALIVGDFDSSDHGRDIIVRSTTGQLQRIYETHALYWPLQYPLLFPYGEDGYQLNIPYRGQQEGYVPGRRTRVSLREFICFHLQIREKEDGIIHKCRRLFQQFVVDCFTMIESQRLYEIRMKQSTIRGEVLQGIEEAMRRGDDEASSIGTRVILPSSFTGGRRYMFNRCQDAMAICKHFGYPDLFLTITCNPNWPEFQRFTERERIPIADRPDISCRVFHAKLKCLLSDLKEGVFFGPLNAGMYTIEFQKRGLPHAHMLLWLNRESNLQSVEIVDEFICAELPNPQKFPSLYNVVTKYMIHGPCGLLRPSSPCMKDGKCSKFYPKRFVDQTSFDEDGYPIYRRRNMGVTVKINDVDIDNRFVVPYNPLLLMKYQAHINLEFCNKSNVIKYLFKYINKGPDRVTATVGETHYVGESSQVVDEIKQYYDCRYLSPSESMWRILAYDIHHRWPSVQRLTFHLPNQQHVVFDDADITTHVYLRNKDLLTMFTAWMMANRRFPDGRSLTYVEYPGKFVYCSNSREWKPRQRGFSIGRLSFAHPSSGELFYMRMLLNVQRGCTSFRSIRTVNGVTYDTFQEACSAMGFLIDDKEYVSAIKEVAEVASAAQLRRFFVILLLSGSMGRPLSVWEQTWSYLSDDILYRRRHELQYPDLTMSQDELQTFCLLEIERLLQSNGKSLRNYAGMPVPNNYLVSQFSNLLLLRELQYDTVSLTREHDANVLKLNEEQRVVYDKIIDCVLNKSGIASLLLPGGKTAHSMFNIPIELTEETVCRIKKDSAKAEVVRLADLIIWDEAPMTNKLAFEALDRTLRDIMVSVSDRNKDLPFGGKVVVLGGDFRQVLPVIPKGSRAEIVMASINSSVLWKYCEVCCLTKNMRLTMGLEQSTSQELRSFSDWILQIGEGRCGTVVNDKLFVEIPSDLIIPVLENPVEDIVNAIYPNLVQNFRDPSFFQDRAILAPTVENVEEINNYIVDLLPGEEKNYLSADSICGSDVYSDVDVDWINVEFLNQIRCSGLPNHSLKLKIGVPIILLRNIDPAGGLCNGTRLVVRDLGRNVIGADIVSGSNVGDKVFISRMNMIPSDTVIPFKFQRRQFPVSLSFAMTINKSQGQTLSTVGLFLRRPVFCHGQLYVAVSRVRNRNGLKILVCGDALVGPISIENVVFTEVFNKI